MNWFILGILVYILIGLILIILSMRGMKVTADFGEWLIILFLWPLTIRLFIFLLMTQSTLKNLERINKNGSISIPKN